MNLKKIKKTIKNEKMISFFILSIFIISSLTITGCFQDKKENSSTLVSPASKKLPSKAPKESSTQIIVNTKNFQSAHKERPEVSVSPSNTVVASPTSKLIESSNKLLEDQYNLAFTKHLQGSYKEAISIADKMINSSPTFYKAYNIKGIALCFSGDVKSGLKLIDKSLTLKPDYGYAVFNKALAYKLLKDFDNSLIWFDKNIALEEYSWSYYGKSTIYAERGDVENTILNLRKAISIESEIKNTAINDKHFNKIKSNIKFKELFNENTALNPEGIVPILGYHGINDKTFGIEALFVKVSDFNQQMKYLKDNNYTVITFDDIPNLKNIKKPIIITFDDGYEDNFLYAYPILKKYNFKATVFVMTDAIDKDNYLKSSQILKMRDLINFQSHTITHELLPESSLKDAEYELSASKEALETLTGQKVNVLAYPVSKYNQDIINLTKKYYTYGTVLNDKVFKSSQNNFTIDRFYISRNLSFSNFIKYVKYD